MDGIFKDLVIVELASVLAGPAIGMFFAELGAKVIKVENATRGGDVTRSWKIKGEPSEGVAAYYHSVNYRKEVLFLNLSDPKDQRKCRQVISNADILVSNFNDRTAEKFNLSYHQLKEPFPKLIYAQLYGFQSNKSRPAYDIVLQAETGFLSMSGTEKGELTRMPVALIDILAAHQLKEGILTALIHRMKTSNGSLVSSSLEEAAISSLANQATNYLMVNHTPVPMGTAHPNIAPYGDIFQSKDGLQLVLSIGSDQQFKQLTKILGNEDLADSSLYDTNEHRVINRKSLVIELASLIMTWIASDLLNACLIAKIPIGKIQNVQEVLDSKIGRSMILEQNEEDGSISKRVKTVAFHIDTK